MEKKTQDFSFEKAQQLADSPEGQKLMSLLQQHDNGQLQKAMDEAASGNYKQAGKILNGLLSSPEARQLIRQLGEKHG